ncbi:K02A2.6-like [Cordylochernes scorpioides]|uniref:RNA-directed DNA polymerase n=1 Tax=Cordylochernes scorpioides TaxID=51811 RepID=A0ABY6LSS4_9ARAC|nr:K02A2.6-like [Cordylochernes scorpioides]
MSQNYNCVAPEPFNFSNPGDWPKWIRRFERFRQASGLINNPENEQVNMLVYCMGDNADDILLSCKIASDQLENYDKVIECFESHFIPRRNIIYERARYNQRCQQEGEKVNEFITALHSLAEHCNFGMLHDELIRDRIVVGVRGRALSERMQLDTDLTLVKATLMAKQLESVKEQQFSLYQQDSVDQIKKMPNHIKETKRDEPKIRQFKSNQLGGSSHGCTRCDNSNNHDWKNCPAMNSYCGKCKKKGHYAKVCRSEAINEIKSEIAFLGSVEDNSKKWIVPIKVNNRQINFKIDTGADVNMLPLQYYYQSFQRIKLEKSDKILQGPNGIPLETVGMIHVKLQNKGQHLNSKIYIVDKLKQPLLSRKTSEKLNIVRMIQQLSSNFLNPKREFPKIFNGLGHAKINYKISLQPDAKPYALCTPRRVPIPLMKQVKEQLEEMTRLGVIESVEEPTEWCAGMVAVSKPGGKIRICVDLTKLNQYIRRENYPLPATEHILGQLGNACYFSKLDANSGFWQFGLAKESQKLTTFITPFGRFFFKRIPFGITSAPEIFQRKMTQLLGKIEGVVCFMDDIVVYGSSLEEHNERVRQVLKKIQEEGMALNPEKCQFGVKTVKFLGHTLSSEGLFIDEEKLDAITKMEAPRSTKELKSFLGMVNYLGKFIPNLADKLQPLNSLLSTKNEWVWDEPQKKSFNLLKQELVSRPNLALFDPSRTTIVSADASSFGLGGILRQEQPDGSLKPIAYVSRTLSETEKRYSQIEKEGLAIVWTCDRLKDYVTGIKIHIETDHKPLIAIFTSKSSEDMTPRLQRLKMRMMRYSYQISHIAGKKQIVADMLSRKPMSKPHKDELEEELSAYIQSIEFPATEERLLEISRKQKEDSLCSQLAKYCMSGWPKNKREVDPALRGYWQFQEDLTYQNGLLLRGQRILIPKSLRKDILEKLHQGHFGINKCRSRAKESVWWLGISQEIERMVSSCTKCLKERKPKHEPLMPSEFPIRPWQKVGMDLFYLNGRWYLIVCDYYSRYPEISLLQNLTAQEVISRLKSIFARHGTPETVRSDNGPQFQKVLGSEFSKFSKEWSFKYITSSPKFPQSNGFIEAIIKNIKQSFKKEEDCYLTLQAYRTMPLESGYSPAELLMGRRLRTSVPAIESSLMPRYLDSEALQEREKRRVINQKRLYDKRHDVHSLPPLQQGDSVWIRDQRVEGTVLHKSEEPRSYWVQTPQGKVRRNRLHLTPLPKMGSTMDASEDGQRQEQRNEETPTSTSTWLSRRCKDDQEQETEEDCPTPTASSTRDGRMQRDNQDQDPEKSPPSMPAVHTRYGRAVKIPRRWRIGERPSDMKASCETSRITLTNKQSRTNSGILIDLSKGPTPGIRRSCVCTHVSAAKESAFMLGTASNYRQIQTFTKVCLDHGAMINESCTFTPHSMRSDVDLHAASPVAQNKQGRVQELGRGFCPISIIQSPYTSHFAASKQLRILQCNINGDLNAKHQLWGCSMPNPRGKILSNLFDDNAFMCLNDGNPTDHSYSYNTAQALDISFSSPDIFHKCKWQILKSIGSEHLPILIEINTKTETSSIKEKFWNFKKANWNLYQQNTNEDFRKAPTTAKVSIPRGNIKKWIPNYTHQAKDIQTHITKRNELQKKCTQNQKNCRTELNIVNAKIKILYVNMKREKWKQTCENMNPRNPNTKLWHLAKQIDRAQPQTENTNMIKNTDGTPATNDKNAANILGNSYQISSKIKFEIKDKKVEKKARKIIHDRKNVTSTHNIFHEKINMKELDYALENTDLNKTPGPDGIHGQMISNLGKNGKERLLDIFNNSWKLENCLKTGKLKQ